MTSYFRLLAGFTSFISKRCRVHFWAIGPSGILASSFTRSPLGDEAGEDEHRGDHEAREDGERGPEREGSPHRVVARVVESHRLGGAPQPVVQVQAERRLGDQIEPQHERALEADDEVVVRAPRYEIGMRLTG